MERGFLRNSSGAALRSAAPGRDGLAFHRRLPGYQPTPLRAEPALARRLGLGGVWLKDESRRLGLPAFKILGASWALYRALETLAGDLGPWASFDELARRLDPLRPLSVTAATDGNHGRALARLARLLGLGAFIFVPDGTAAARIDALREEGAEVTVVAGTYDEALACSAALAGPRCLLISDVGLPGADESARWAIEGYATLFWEIDDALGEYMAPQPDLVVVPVGAGSLAAAAVRHYRRPALAAPPRLIGVEPTGAACALASMRAGRIVAVPGPHTSIMAGLNCDSPSAVAWPLISTGLDLFLAVEDDAARQAMRDLAALGVAAGETGAAALAGLTQLLGSPELAEAREALGITAATTALLLMTEGVTDPAAYASIVGAEPPRTTSA